MRVRWHVVGDVGVVVADPAIPMDSDNAANDETRRPRGTRVAELLALLLIRRNRVVTTESIIDAIWPDDPPPTARNSVQRFVSDLRGVLGPARSRLVTDGNGYRLDVREGELDVSVLEAIAAEVRATVPTVPPDEAFALLRSLIDQLDVDLFPGIDELAVVDQERTRFAALRGAAIEEAADAAVRGDLAVAEQVADWVLAQPHNEKLTAHLMELLARRGRVPEALEAFKRLSAVLLEEHGVSPSPALVQLELDILRQDVAMDSPLLARVAAPASGTGDLIGRDDLLRRIDATLDTASLLTLVGPGGVGKTSLASQVVRSQSPAERSPMVMLADIDSADLMLESVANAIGLDPLQTRTLDELGQAMGQRVAGQGASLLVLDNAEHLIDDVAQLVSAALSEPAVAILVTSREPLGISGEHVIDVESLPVVGVDGTVAPAVELFAERAAAASAVSADEVAGSPIAIEICEMLDGIPLALELAAVQLRTFTLTELASHLRRSLDLLAQPRRNDRHSSLEAVVQWSWDLLDPDERRFLAMLSPYRGFSSAIAELIDERRGPRLLSQLVSKSLVQADTSAGDRTRCSLLTSVREFALDRCADLGLDDDAEGLLAQSVLSNVRRWTLADSLGAAEAHDDVEADLYNTLTALDWLAEHGCTRDAIDLMTRAGGMFSHRGPIAEGGQRFAAVKAKIDAGWRCPIHGSVHDEDVDEALLGAFLTAMSANGSASGNMDHLFGCGFAAVELVKNQPHDWAVEVLGTMAFAVRTANPAVPVEHLLEMAEALAPRTPSADANVAYVSIWRAFWQMMDRRYEAAIESFGRTLDTDARPGRNLLHAECGLMVANHMLGRHEAARELANTTRSRADTDAWHHVIDVVRAIALAPTDASEAARVIEGVIADAPLSDFPGRQHDVNLGVGVVAYWAGQPEETERLLADSFGRTPVAHSILVEYHDADPGREMSDTAWAERWETVVRSRIDAQRVGEGWMHGGAGGMEGHQRRLNALLQRI